MKNIFIIILSCFLTNVSCNGTQNQYSLPNQEDWLDYGIVISAGKKGMWDYNLEGMISPCAVIKKDNLYFLYYIGADGYRKSDGGPRYRSLGVATSKDGINFRKYSGNPILEFLPHHNEEEGIFSSAVCLDSEQKVILFYGAMKAKNSTATKVNSNIRLATSNDGFNFTDLGDVLSFSDPSVWGYGDELFPVGVFKNDINWYIYYLAKGKKVMWGLGVAWGPEKDKFSDSQGIINEGNCIGACQPFALSAHKIGFLILRDFKLRNIEVRTAKINSPVNLTQPDKIYNFSNCFHFTQFFDNKLNRWLLYYFNKNNICLKIFDNDNFKIPVETK